MTPSRWQEIERIYNATLALPPIEWQAFLANACEGDAELRREVESLLAQDSSKPGALDRPAWEGAAGFTGADSTVTMVTPGTQLGSYRIEGRLGKGGMGEVFHALDTKLNRPVAIKFLFDDLADAAARRRFQREARLTSSLNHPHILTVHDIGEFGGRQYLVSEYIDGGTLNHWAKSGKREWRDAVELLVGVADGLATAHEAGILHRDIKPANILITKSGYAKLADFGLAKLAEYPDRGDDSTRTLTDELTRKGTVIGTIAYMSPEQASGKRLDARSDIFSFAIVLYEMIAGHRPFEGETDLEILQTIIHGSPQALPEHIPVQVRTIVEKALEKDPAQRYQSMGEMVAHLRRLIRQSVETPVAPAMSRPPVRRLKWAAAAAAMVLVMGAAGWWRIHLARPGPQIRSLAVLPLTNLSGDPDQEYFADGMTEALTTGLAQIGALNVISRTSVMRYRGTKKTTPEIAGELHVDGLVEGSVQRSNGRLRINVQLIEGSSDRHLWANSYQRDEQDALALQNEVAQAIAGEIRVTLTSQEQARLSAPHPLNPEAQEAYLRGLYAGDKRDVRKFHEYMKQAIQKDPGYALAYAALGNSYGVMTYAGQIPADEAFPKWRESVTKALSLDDNLAEAHNSLAALLFFHDYNWPDSEREFRRALQLNPNLVDAHLWLGDVLMITGRMEECVTQNKRGLQLNPNSVQVNRNLGKALILARRYDEAIALGQTMLELDPASAHWVLAFAYEQKGNLERAIREYQEVIKGAGGDPDLATWAPGELAHAYAVAGRKQEALQTLAGLQAMSKLARVDPAVFAMAYAGLGEKDAAFEWLNKSYDDRPSMAVTVKVEPRFELLRSDPRFQAFLRKMGLPDETGKRLDRSSAGR